MDSLNGTRVAILITDGFEHVEMIEPRKALDEAGAETVIVSPQTDQVRAWDHVDWSKERIEWRSRSRNADPQSFDALLLPGGVMNPDHLRMDAKAVAFVKAFSTRASLSRQSATLHG